MKSKRCPICKKEIRGLEEKSLNWNLKLHLEKHKKGEEENKNEKK
jgi:glutaredoxin